MFIILLQLPDNLKTYLYKHPRGLLPWDIHKFVSDSPHGLDIFFRCNLSQLLADIPDDTEHSTAYIHRFLLPDCPINLLFRENSSWLTGKIRQGMKFVILCQRNFLPLIRCLVAERVNTESGILKNRICIQPHHSLSLVSLYRISPEAAPSLFQLDPWFGG